MPEIAEVRTVATVLKKQILNKKIKDVNVLYKGIITNDLDYFKECLIGNEILDIKTKGKWLLFYLNDYILLSHLRMEGKYFIKNIEEEINKHEHVIFEFENFSLRYHDTRKFGKMTIIKQNEIDTYESLSKLGPEPFDKTLTKDYLYNKLHNKNLSIKTLLLDQTIINGLGNIYANEVLFESGINPTKVGKEINIDECQKIIESSKKIVKKAIEEGGTTIKSYTSSLGVEGNYQKYLRVHMKENEECSVCKNKIEKIKVNGRSTYYCPKCQKWIYKKK